ncbi:CDP-alcohol phosphatidyltransferase family protein [Halocatena halophila]|uniref:CDP-alcohol phosphatidyltransferase family protein n=1 Tax=Halocatena halophila TaxID=2814576 RepID=UPI002ED0CD1E
MRPHPLCRVSLADGVSITNLLVGFGAICVLTEPTVGGLDSHAIGARAILLGAIADGLDGLLARYGNHSQIGAVLDSVVDVVTFGVAPGLFVVTLANRSVDATGGHLLVAGLASAYVVGAVVRTAIYTTEDAQAFRRGVPNTLGAVILAGSYLAGLDDPLALAVLAGLFAYLMVIETPYPGLQRVDAVGVGSVQTLAIVLPPPVGRLLAGLLVVVALAYLLGGPSLYRNRGIMK